MRAERAPARSCLATADRLLLSAPRDSHYVSNLATLVHSCCETIALADGAQVCPHFWIARPERKCNPPLALRTKSTTLARLPLSWEGEDGDRPRLPAGASLRATGALIR